MKAILDTPISNENRSQNYKKNFRHAKYTISVIPFEGPPIKMTVFNISNGILFRLQLQLQKPRKRKQTKRK